MRRIQLTGGFCVNCNVAIRAGLTSALRAAADFAEAPNTLHVFIQASALLLFARAAN